MSLSDKLRKAITEAPKRIWTLRPEVLLCQNTPKPMHGVVPREILGSKWWNQTRQAAYKSTDFHCIACGVHKSCAKNRQWLEGHELYEVDYAKGRQVYIETIPLCHFCHNYIHDGRLQMLLQSGKLHQAKFVAIIQHGDDVLARVGLVRPNHVEREVIILNQCGTIAEWSNWRLVLNNKLYPPKYKTYDEWETAMTKFNEM